MSYYLIGRRDNRYRNLLLQLLLLLPMLSFFVPPFYAGFLLYADLSCYPKIVARVTPVIMIPDMTNAPITICSSFRFIFCSILFFGSECCHFCLLYCFVDNKAPHCYNEQSARCCCYHMIFSFRLYLFFCTIIIALCSLQNLYSTLCRLSALLFGSCLYFLSVIL